MSSQISEWEIVSNTKGKKVSSKTSRKVTDAKTFYENSPKYEDVVQLSSSLFTNVMDQYEPDKKDVLSQDKNKIPKDKKSKQKAPSKLSKPICRTLPEAAKEISSSEIKNAINTLKKGYPENQLLWLRDVANLLNIALSRDTDTLSIDRLNCFFDDSPMILLTKELRKNIVILLQEVTDTTRQLAFEAFIVNMAHDLAKGIDVYGYMIMIQFLTDAYPHLSLTCSVRLSELIKSYHNRTLIGQALLWSVGQGGRKDFYVGIKVWIDFMLPLINLRHYGTFVVDYIEGLLLQHNSKKVFDCSDDNFALVDELQQTPRRFFYTKNFLAIYDAVYSTSNISLQNRLRKIYPLLNRALIGQCHDGHELFPELLKRMAGLNSSHVQQRNDLLDSLLYCLVNHCETSIFFWSRMYTTHLQASAFLLQGILERWKCMAALSEKTEFNETIEAFAQFNISSKKYEARNCHEHCLEIISRIKDEVKYTNGDGNSRRRTWKVLSFRWLNVFMLVCLGLLIRNDLIRHGGRLEATNIGHFLQDTKLLWAVQKPMNWCHRTWTDYNGPEYYRVYIGPALDEAFIRLRIAKGYIESYWSIMIMKVETWRPGTLKQLSYLRRKSLILISRGLNKVVHFAAVVWEQCKVSLAVVGNFVENNEYLKQVKFQLYIAYEFSFDFILKFGLWFKDRVNTDYKYLTNKIDEWRPLMNEYQSIMIKTSYDWSVYGWKLANQTIRDTSTSIAQIGFISHVKDRANVLYSNLADYAFNLALWVKKEINI